MTDFDIDAYLADKTPPATAIATAAPPAVGSAPAGRAPAFDVNRYLNSPDDPDDPDTASGDDSSKSRAPKAPPKRVYVSPLDDPSTRSGQGGIAGNITDVVDTAVGKAVTGTIGAVGGGYKALADILQGKGADQAADDVRNFAAKVAYQPAKTAAATNTAAAMDSSWNPLNLPVTVGHGLGRASEAVGLPPWMSAGFEALPTAAGAALGLRSGIAGDAAARPKIMVPDTANDPSLVPALRDAARNAAGSNGPPGTNAPAPGAASAPRVLPPDAPPGAGLDLSVTPSAPRAYPSSAPAQSAPPPSDLSLAPSAPRTTAPGASGATPAPAAPLTAAGLPRGQMWEPLELPGNGPSGSTAQIDAEPIKGGVDSDAHGARAAILNRVGLETARDSALEGNALKAATDAQLTKFDEPAGQAMKAQFDAEKGALEQHAQSIVRRVGGTVGTDEDTLNTKGQTMAAPFDALRDYIKTQQQAAYDAADARSGGAPVTKLEGLGDLLKNNNDFRETLIAKGQDNLLGSMQRQFDTMQQLHPDGLPVRSAENLRKWINTTWTPENSATLGQVKGVLDDDVLKGAGEDIYGPARQLTQIKAQLLDNPDGVSQLFDRDPLTPLNRTTPYVKIPDTLNRLDPEQYRNVLQTLQNMPPAIQPLAQAAIGEIRGHLVNKMLDAGVGKTPETMWNSPAVSDVIKKNTAKLNTAFGNDPAAVQSIRDLDSAGRILRANPSYPGAAAQTANALKRGMMTRAINAVGAAAGAGIGSHLGPFGAAAGAGVGENIAGRFAQGAGEAAALKRVQGRLVPLSSYIQGPGPPPQ